MRFPLPLFALLCCAVAASGAITVTIQSPQSNQVVSNSFNTKIRVDSLYEVASVQAAFGTNRSLLTYSTSASAWVGTIESTGLFGQEDFTVNVTDVFTNQASGTIPVVVDRRPTFLIRQPLNYRVWTKKDLPVDAEAIDDDPANPPRIIARLGAMSLGGTASWVRGTFSVSSVTTPSVTVNFEAVDSRGQKTSITQLIPLEKSPQFTEQAHIPYNVQNDIGIQLLDDNEEAFIYSRPTNWNGVVIMHALVHYDKRSGMETQLNAEHYLGPAYLLGNRVAFNRSSGFYFWAPPSSPSKFAEGNDGIQSGAYAAFISQSVFYRRQMLNGTTDVIRNVAVDNFVLLKSGDVAFVEGNELKVWSNGRLSTIAREEDGFGRLVTDGERLAWMGGLIVEGARHILNIWDGKSVQVVDRESYAPRLYTQGWLAYTKKGSAGQDQIWLAGTNSQTRQLTFFGTNSIPLVLNSRGDLLFSKGEERSFVPNGGTLAPLGRYTPATYFLKDDRIHYRLGSSILRLEHAVSTEQRVTNDGFVFDVAPIPGFDVQVDGSNDNIHWSPVASIDNTTGSFSITNNQFHFFRFKPTP